MTEQVAGGRVVSASNGYAGGLSNESRIKNRGISVHQDKKKTDNQY